MGGGGGGGRGVEMLLSKRSLPKSTLVNSNPGLLDL